MNSVLVTGLAHNVEFHIEKELIRIEKHMAKIFSIVKFLIIESDSADRTKSILTNMTKENKNLKLISFDKLATVYPYRVDRITYCRNVYVNEIRSNQDLIPLNYEHMDIVSSFAIPVIAKDNQLASEYMKRFEGAQVEFRPMIAGSMARQPFYRKYIANPGIQPNAEFIHRNSFYFGNNPELTDSEINLLGAQLRA